MSAMDNFIRGIKILIDTAINKAPYDATYQGIIISNEGNNLYTLDIKGKTYEHTPSLTNVELKHNDIVKVVFPQNNSSLRYIISNTGNIVGLNYEIISII